MTSRPTPAGLAPTRGAAADKSPRGDPSIDLEVVPLQRAQRLLGHSEPKLTAQIYTHSEADDLRDAVEVIPEPGPGRSSRGELILRRLPNEIG